MTDASAHRGIKRPDQLTACWTLVWQPALDHHVKTYFSQPLSFLPTSNIDVFWWSQHTSRVSTTPLHLPRTLACSAGASTHPGSLPPLSTYLEHWRVLVEPAHIPGLYHPSPPTSNIGMFWWSQHTSRVSTTLLHLPRTLACSGGASTHPGSLSRPYAARTGPRKDAAPAQDA